MRVAIAEDSGFFRDALAESLKSGGIDITATAGDIDELMRALKKEIPDAVILDVCLPPTKTDEGLRAAEELGKSHPSVGVLVLSAHLSTPHVTRLLSGRQNGVGCLAKDQIQDIDLVIEALNRITEGGVFVDPDFVDHRSHVETIRKLLTPREMDLLKLVAEGFSNQGIADRQGVGVKTVETMLTSVFRKLSIDSKDGNARVRAVLKFLTRPHGSAG